MRKQIVTVALVSGLGLSSAALLAPALASADDSTTTSTTTGNGIADRITRIKDALKSLVTDGTLTQAQADKVATTLADKLPPRGPGGPGRGPGGFVAPDAIAKVLGISVDDLRTAQGSGKTLTQIAASKGISKSTLISKLVAAAKEHLAADVKAGRLTQAQADQISSGLTARVTEMVDRVCGPGGMGGGRGDHGFGGPAPDGQAPGSQAPSTTTPAPSATSSAT